MVANYFAFEPLIDEQLTLARLLITQYRMDKQFDLQPLFRFLERQLQLAEVGGWTDLTIRLLILKALAVQAQDGVTQAIPILQRALTLAEPGDYVRLFVEEGTQIATLLAKILDKQRKGRRSREHDLTYSYAAKLLTVFPPEERLQTAPSPLVEPLSPRELELLEFIATGASNQEIAQELFITVNTVKKHITHIFGKLEATRRTQAVARARELGLIE
jgi:LuxR family maltose regulon positive regulatory protein